MNLSLTYYFLLFMIYSVAGWMLEVTCKLIDYKRFVNRGFLIGPYCPIYGFGAILITALLYRYAFDTFLLFIMTILSCGILEYSTSYVMEKIFKARWWDYSKRMFNLNGRICLGTIIPFGIFGILLTYITNPFLVNLLDRIDGSVLNIIAVCIFIIFVLDIIVSLFVILGFRKTTLQVNREERRDDTEQITKKVREILGNKAWTYKRLINAYPQLVAIKTKIKEFTDEVKENAVDLKNNINEKAQDVKNNITEKASGVKNTINDKTVEVKNNIADTKNAIANSLKYGTKKIKITLNLSKKRMKKTFKGRKN